ncbi:MAG: flagellar export chaperone FliS [Acidobacteria bacterium]|nr:flagellar export chaperone FliS [Acidobacteriota bacterium]
MTPPTKATDQYLAQRVAGASPEELHAMLLEAGQRYLGKAIRSIQRKDLAAKTQELNRVLSIIEELTVRLNLDQGGDLVMNLVRIYEWWNREILQASMSLETAPLERVSRFMGEMRQTWMTLHQQRCAVASEPAASLAADLAG